MTQALYRKWRPARFADIVGQEHVTQTLQKSVSASRIGHAYLFSGPRGTGKTTMARLLAKAANCLSEDLSQRPCNRCGPCLAVNEGRFLDLIEIDAASNTGVDDIRDLRDKISFSPGEGRFKVYIIDEVHMLSPAAFNALLKTLEEPPAHVIFVLATTEEHKVPLTIRSRCQLFQFRLLTRREIMHRLAWLAEQEQLVVDEETLSMIAFHGAGSLRDAESLLDQLVTAPGDEITLERAQMVLGTASDEALLALADAWLAGDSAAGLAIIHQALSRGADARQFARQMVAHLRHLLLLQAGGREITLDVSRERQQELLAQARRAERPQLVEAVKAFNEASVARPTGWLPQLSLELAFIELLPEGYAPSGVSGAKGVRENPVIVAEPEVEPLRAEPEIRPDQESGTVPAKIEVEGKDPSEHREGGQRLAATLEDVVGLWPQLRERIRRRSSRLPELLASCKPLAFDDNVLILGFGFDILKDKFDSDREARTIVEQTLGELLDISCTLRTVVSGQYKQSTEEKIAHDDFAALAEELGGVVQNN